MATPPPVPPPRPRRREGDEGRGRWWRGTEEARRGRGEGREGGEKKRKKNSKVWVPHVVVGIERRYRELMGAEKLNIELRILMTRMKYSA